MFGLPSFRLAETTKLLSFTTIKESQWLAKLATSFTISPSGYLSMRHDVALSLPACQITINCQSLCKDVVVYSCHNDIELEVFNHFKVDSRCQEKLSRFTQDKDKLNTILGRYLLHYALRDERYLDIKYQPKGKPFLPGLHFNISHCDTQVVLAVSLKNEIGIDIEDIIPIHLPDYTHCFNQEEWHYITSAADPYYAFYRLWTRKEAILKATGQGLMDNLCKLNVLKDVVNLQDKEWRLIDSCEGGRVFSCAMRES